MSSKPERKSISLSYTLLDENQQNLIDAAYNYDEKLIIADMGFGKTVCLLTAINELLEGQHLSRILVVAPKEACLNVWANEHSKWDHLKALDIGVAVGDKAHRTKVMDAQHTITVINFETLQWLDKVYKIKKGYFDGILIDEMSKLTQPSGAIWKVVYRIANKCKWRVGLTATPVHESLLNLYGMLKIIDRGKAIGTNKEKFLREYFFPLDYHERNWQPKSEADAKRLLDDVAHVLHIMPSYTDSLPKIDYHYHKVELLPEHQATYKKLKKEMHLEFEGDESLVYARNQGVLSGKLAQCANGFIYMGGKENEVKWLCRQRVMDTTKKILELVEIHKHIIVCIWFRPIMAAIRELIGKVYPPLSVAGHQDENAFDRWNNKELNVLFVQPRGVSHGLNLMQGGSVIYWPQPYWSNDMWAQMNSRVWRRGQTEECHIYVDEAVGTVDEVMMKAIELKGEWHVLLRAHLEN